MTKFILHGGGANMPLEGNKQFYNEILTTFDSGKILIIYFSRDEREWAQLFDQDKENFKIQGKNIELEVADLDPEKFKEQIKSANALYVRGGDTFKLLEKNKANFRF